MNSEALEQVRRGPPNRKAVGSLTLLILRFRGVLARFFAARHPGNFDLEFGSWTMPDYSLYAKASDPPPRPLVNKDCQKTYLIYNLVEVPTAQCNRAGQMAAAAAALHEVVGFFDNHYRCTNDECPDKRYELLWIGLTCQLGSRDAGAVLVRFSCRPRIEV